MRWPESQTLLSIAFNKTSPRPYREFSMTTAIRRLVLDVLKPHIPTILELAEALSKLGGITGVNLSLSEVDQQTETIKITIKGDKIDYLAVESVIQDFGGVIHSIDEVVAGKEIVEEVETAQDR
jgi:hypothetical protein